MKSVDPDKSMHHRGRAEAFLEGMKLLATDMQAYRYGVALLAVHAGISMADAILVACTGRRSNERDHRSVLKPLGKLCHSRRADAAGLDHLEWLLSRKTDFAYGDKRLRSDEAIAAKLNVERFVSWAYKTFREELG